MGGIVLGFAIAHVLQVNNQRHAALFALCCGAIPFAIFSLLGASEIAKEFERQEAEDADEWDRSVNATRPNPDGKPESN
jgi:hypothetical protein